ncbi:MAG: hypothetical protein ABL925_01505 [Methylococcales bacterium]
MKMSSKSINAQINTELQQVAAGQNRFLAQRSRLINNCHQQITAPGTLLLTAGLGFIFGELTKNQTTEFVGSVNNLSSGKSSPLQTALNLTASMRTLYMILPLTWIMKNAVLDYTSKTKTVRPDQNHAVGLNQ